MLIRAIMKLLCLLAVLLVSPLMSSSQGVSASEEKTIYQPVKPLLNSEAQLAMAKFYVAKEYVVKINYKKSRELTSIRAFRKATQIRAKKHNKC